MATSKTLVVNTSSPQRLDLEGTTLYGQGTPTPASDDLATTQYVDDAVAGGVAGESILTPVAWDNASEQTRLIDLFTLSCELTEEMVVLVEFHAVMKAWNQSDGASVIAHALYKYVGSSSTLTLVQQNSTLFMADGSIVIPAVTFGVSASKITAELDWGASISNNSGTAWAKMQYKKLVSGA